MAMKLVVALSLSLAVSSVLGEFAQTLTKSNFDQMIMSDIILVKFYAPWCGHCKAMAPAYEEAAEKLSEQGIPLAKVDGTEEPEITQAQSVKGFPTLKVFRKGVASDYTGPRDMDGIVRYMTEAAGSESAAVASPSDADHVSPLLGWDHVATLCQDQACTEEKFPMIDYDEDTKKCHCAAHPCWNDEGTAHHCSDPEAPHLSFSYTKEGVLECGCKKEPHYTSQYIAQKKCPGEHCEEQGENYPIVDFDPKENKCICRAHPCHNIDGLKHGCSDPKFPVLAYHAEVKNGDVKQVCDCKAAFHNKVSDEL